LNQEFLENFFAKREPLKDWYDSIWWN